MTNLAINILNKCSLILPDILTEFKDTEIPAEVRAGSMSIVPSISKAVVNGSSFVKMHSIRSPFNIELHEENECTEITT